MAVSRIGSPRAEGPGDPSRPPTATRPPSDPPPAPEAAPGVETAPEEGPPHGVSGWTRALARRWSSLRWVLLAGAVARLVLAPLTSWGLDTPSFILAEASLLLTGNPYTSSLLFNPPVAAFLEAPGFAVLAALGVGPDSWAPFVAPAATASILTGMTSSVIPIAPALLALKLPLIVADLATGVGLYELVLPRWGGAAARWAAAAWLLNPLTIWVSSVHGEVDPVVALLLVAFLIAVQRGAPFASGVALGLAALTKVYPVVLIPLVAAYWFTSGVGGRGAAARRLATFALGAAGAALPFLALLLSAATSVGAVAVAPQLGGLSLLVAFNPASPRFPGGLAVLQAPALASLEVGALEALGVIAVVGAPVLWLLKGRRLRGAARTDLLGLLVLWPLVGTILADASPQSEDVLGLLVVLLAVAPTLRRWGASAFVLLSGTAFAFYLALLGPFAYFYPLATDLGTGSVLDVNRWVLAFYAGWGPVTRGLLWLLLGVLAGALLLALYGLVAATVVRRPGGEPNDGPSGEASAVAAAP